MSIKKSYTEIVSFLKANQNKKVSSIMDEILSMAESKKQSSTHFIDAEGNVIAIFCYYHKQWEFVSEVEYGSKANTATGLNTMCKVGNSKWTKKQRVAKQQREALLDEIVTGAIKPDEIEAYKADIESNRLAMDTEDMPIGFTDEQFQEELKLCGFVE